MNYLFIVALGVVGALVTLTCQAGRRFYGFAVREVASRHGLDAYADVVIYRRLGGGRRIWPKDILYDFAVGLGYVIAMRFAPPSLRDERGLLGVIERSMPDFNESVLGALRHHERQAQENGDSR